ncbi:MAG: class C beta-lactamase-related serine hydrolase [Sphingomonadaceae bacterium]|nr:MAG: class C beta-lactamase-related serine hydrolase [Sphingomonadaceae bacterium]
MIRDLVLAAAALLFAAPALAQSQQDELNARYDRALAAGYKAMFLCSAIANAERAGTTRAPESVLEWELTGIQSPLDTIITELPAQVVRNDEGLVDGVLVEWADDSPPRMAMHHVGHGCRAAPIGATPASIRNVLTDPVSPGRGISAGSRKVSTQIDPRLAQAAFSTDYGEGARTTAVIVQQDGEVVSEAFGAGFSADMPQRTWSVAKSIAATLIGAAVQRAEADVTASAGLGAAANDPRRAITIDHLLRMASGRFSDTPGNRTDPLYFGGATVEETAAAWPLIHAPGTVYRYANNDTLMAIKAIEDTFGTHPPADFFAKVGMPHTVAETDWHGDYILSSQVWSTASDLAKLGQLYLDDGVLSDGTRILPEGWVDYVSAPSGPQPEERGIGYGAGFWLFNRNEGIPTDTFAAMGNRGQYVVIVPSRNVVIVRRGEDPVGARFDIVAFTRDVLAALGK